MFSKLFGKLHIETASTVWKRGFVKIQTQHYFVRRKKCKGSDTSWQNKSLSWTVVRGWPNCGFQDEHSSKFLTGGTGVTTVSHHRQRALAGAPSAAKGELPGPRISLPGISSYSSPFPWSHKDMSLATLDYVNNLIRGWATSGMTRPIVVHEKAHFNLLVFPLSSALPTHAITPTQKPNTNKPKKQQPRHNFLQTSRISGKFNIQNETGLLYFISYDKGRFLKQKQKYKTKSMLAKSLNLDSYTQEKRRKKIKVVYVVFHTTMFSDHKKQGKYILTSCEEQNILKTRIWWNTKQPMNC